MDCLHIDFFWKRFVEERSTVTWASAENKNELGDGNRYGPPCWVQTPALAQRQDWALCWQDTTCGEQDFTWAWNMGLLLSGLEALNIVPEIEQ
jgi:hypothetical protein